MDFFQQGIPLGRWFGVSVVIHWTFLLFAAYEIFGGNQRTAQEMEFGALVIGVFLVSVLLHEFGHAISCKAMGGKALHIVIWPLGGMTFTEPAKHALGPLVTTACGPLVNAILWPVFSLITGYMEAHGAPSRILYECCYLMALINKILLLFNLLPGYPMDGGRLLQQILSLTIGYQLSLQIAGMVGTVVGAAFIVLGLGLRQVTIADITLGDKLDIFLILIGIMCAQQSWGIYQRSQETKSWRKN